MPTANVNGVRLYYELNGVAELPLVFVHGLWSSHESWDAVAPLVSDSFRAIVYDRRGYSQSERPPGWSTLVDDIADLGALIEHLGVAPAWVVGNSEGGAIGLRLACERPDLVQGIVVHEPGFFTLLEDDPAFSPMLDGLDRVIGAVSERIAAGAHEEATELFIETALGAGSWAQMPRASQQKFIENALTFLDYENDPERHLFDHDWVKGFSRPALLTTGEQSPPFLGETVVRLAAALPGAEVASVPGAGHSPQRTHPEAYVELITAFVRKHSE